MTKWNENAESFTGEARRLAFTRQNGPVDDAIENLMEMAGGIRRPRYVREMILAALKAGQEDGGNADLKMMNTTLKELRFTAKVFGDYREVRKVTVFGSARTRPSDPIYQMARQFGRELAQRGFMVITGGGPGVMQATNEGAGSEHSFGVNIRLPHEQEPNPVLRDSPRVITYKYFFSRKVAFLKEAHAVALFPGGFGTLDEAMETLTLVQTGKHNPMPLLLLEPPGGTYWRQFLDFLERQLVPGGYISPDDLTFVERFDTAKGAAERIALFYERYHSLRLVGEDVVVRLNRALTREQVAALTTQFADILKSPGAITLSGPLPQEADEPEIAHLPRLVVPFNRTSFSRFNQLIHAVNTV